MSNTTNTNKTNPFAKVVKQNNSELCRIHSSMISDAGCDALNLLVDTGLVSQEDRKDYYLYATSQGAYDKAVNFLPQNIAYTGHAHQSLTKGSGQDLAKGKFNAIACWKKGRFAELSGTLLEMYDFLHSLCFLGGGSGAWAVKLQAQKLYEQLQKSLILSDNEEDFDIDAFASSMELLGLMATMVMPRSFEEAKNKNAIAGLNSIIYNDNGVYNPPISYQIIKIDDLDSNSNAGSLSPDEILQICALHFHQTNLIIKKFLTSESIQDTNIDYSEVAGAIDDKGEMVINRGEGKSMTLAWNNFKDEYVKLNSTATIEGALHSLVMFEYPADYVLTQEDSKEREQIIRAINKQTNTNSNSSIIKYTVTTGNVTQPTINCMFTGISSEDNRLNTASKSLKQSFNSKTEQLKKDAKVINGEITKPPMNSVERARNASNARWGSKN